MGRCAQASSLISSFEEHLSMKRGNLSRRGFLQRSLAALTAAGLPAWYGREVLAQKTGEPAQPAPSDRITIGIVGIGEPGTKPQPRGVQLFNDFKGQKDVQFVAACDVDSGRLDLGAKMIGEHYKSECQKFADYRKMLERDDINAVIIATPDHWHSLIALEAMRRGKDVYCEKPLTLFIDEGKALVKMAAEKKIIFQTGSQQRSADQFRLACELIRNGRIGKVKRIETRIGTNPKGGPYKPCEPHKELDFDFWLGPTPESVFAVKDYCEEMIHYHYRWNYNWSGGKLTDWGAHHNDIAQWALGKDDSGPIAVEGTGEEPSKEKYAYNCHPTFRVVYTYDMGADCKFAEKSVEVVCTHMRWQPRSEGNRPQGRRKGTQDRPR
jgi:predicted dehydrogenase